MVASVCAVVAVGYDRLTKPNNSQDETEGTVNHVLEVEGDAGVTISTCYGAAGGCSSPCTVSSAIPDVCTNLMHEGRASSYKFTCGSDKGAKVNFERFAELDCKAANLYSKSAFNVNQCYPDPITGGGTTYACEVEEHGEALTDPCWNTQECCNAISDADECRQHGCKYSRYGCVPQ